MVFHHKSSNKPQIPFAPAFSGPIGSSLFLFLPSQMENSISLEYIVAKFFWKNKWRISISALDSQPGP